MGAKRPDLDEAQWTRIEPLLPGMPSDPGRTESNNRLFVTGVLRVLRSSARPQHLPVRYGNGRSRKGTSAAKRGRGPEEVVR